jgi:hypothetical protein
MAVSSLVRTELSASIIAGEPFIQYLEDQIIKAIVEEAN